MSRSTEALADIARRRTENAEKAVHKALRRARKDGAPVTVKGPAAAAGVSTDFIYRHPDLRNQVEALRRALPYCSSATCRVRRLLIGHSLRSSPTVAPTAPACR